MQAECASRMLGATEEAAAGTREAAATQVVETFGASRRWLAALVALGIGVLAGLVNGMIITRLKINSFITTLATLFVFTGLVHDFSEGYAYTNIPREFTFLGRQKFLGLSNLFWVMGLALLAIHYMFRHTVFGRRLLATGGNLEAARLSGIDTDCMILKSHLLSGALAALEIRCAEATDPRVLQLEQPEGYTLTVPEADDGGSADVAVLGAESVVGALQGLESLAQLAYTASSTATSSGVRLPVVRGSDAPRFPWRGLSVDVARHFLPLSTLRTIIGEHHRLLTIFRHQ